MKYPNIYLCDRKEGGYVEINKDKIIPPAKEIISAGVIEIRMSGVLKDKAIFLSNEYDWVIARDEENILCLVQLQKENLKCYGVELVAEIEAENREG